MTKQYSIKIICDNGGGIILQLPSFAHYYQDATDAATDLSAYMATDSTHGWDGHEDDAAECDPTLEEIQNGGYRVYCATNLDEVRDELTSMEQSGFVNAEMLAAAMRTALA